MTITFTAGGNAPQINLNNSNAAALLRVLGLPVNPWGEVPAAELRERVLLALGLAADNGQAPVEEGRWVQAGRPAGHLHTRLEELYDLAEWAERHNTIVHWI